MAYKHVIRAKTKNLMTDEMFTSAGFTKQPDGSWYVPDSVVLNNKVMWENTEGIAGPITMSFYGRSSAPYYAGVAQWLVEAVDGTITYRTPTGTSSEWVYGTWTFDSKTVSKVYWVNISNRPLYLRDVMFEWGSTPTPYTPYNYLSSNKRMIKVSDVCQLYAKNIWKEYTDLYGVSIKNNNDGSITLNGTATQTFYYTNRLDYEIKPNHKYLYVDYYPQTPSWDTYVGGCEGKVNHESAVMFAIYNMNNDGTIDPSSPNLPSNTLLNTFCMVYKGFTLNNVTIKPQLFDLTEMFGSGHEPATVAEFRQRFPNELYPYSPQCWLTSYKSAVVCKTKNLFDKSKADVISREYYFTLNQDAGSNFYVMNVKPGITYTVSFEMFVESNDVMATSALGLSIQTGTHYWDGTRLLIILGNEKRGVWVKRSGQFTIPSDINQVTFSGVQNRFLYRNFMVQEGTTATDYVPYGYV